MSINKVVLPIAGLGTRFLPFTKVIPKEMLPINGVPILQLLLEEAYKAGIQEAILIINREKEPIFRSFLSKESPVTKKISEKGSFLEIQRLNNLIDSMKFHYVYQDEQLGDGHAILQAKSFVENEPFAVLFGDDIIVPNTNKNALSQLINAHEKTSSCIIALEKIPPEKSESYGVIKPKHSQTAPTASPAPLSDTISPTASPAPHKSPMPLSPTTPLYEIEDLVEKPTKETAPSNLGIIGKYIVNPEIFDALQASKTGIGGETRIIDGFKKLLETQSLYGLEIDGSRYDTGTLEGYKKAISEISK